MRKKKKTPISKCCNTPVDFMPPSMGEPGQFFCTRCSKFCEIKIENKDEHTR